MKACMSEAQLSSLILTFLEKEKCDVMQKIEKHFKFNFKRN